MQFLIGVVALWVFFGWCACVTAPVIPGPAQRGTPVHWFWCIAALLAFLAAVALISVRL